MEKRTIWVKPSTFAPEFEMIIPVPTDRDDEEYIDELLDGILNDEFRYNIEQTRDASYSLVSSLLGYSGERGHCHISW